MSSYSDYGKLEAVVLGVAENYQPHVWGWDSGRGPASNFTKAIALAKTAVPDSVRSEVIEDLSDFEANLKALGIMVERPPRIEQEESQPGKYFLSWGNDFYNMRDLHIVLGKVLLVSAPSCPARLAEITRLKNFIENLAGQYGLKPVWAPTPQLTKNPVKEYFLQDGELKPLENVIGPSLGGDYEEIWHRLSNSEPLFDAANIARLNEEVIFLISSTANISAFNWFSKHFTSAGILESTDVYRSSHIDSTIMPLTPEIVLVNGARVNQANLPKTLKNKKVLYFNDPAPIPESERLFNLERKRLASQILELGFYTNLSEMSSPWAGLNVLSISEDLVAVESNQLALIRFLEANGFSVMPVRYRHPYTFLGGLHCSTLDVHRT